MSKIESGKITLDNYAFDLSKTIENICDIMKNGMVKKSIFFTFKSDIKQLCVVSDEVKVKQVIVNILSNAVKFTRPFGHITFIVNLIKHTEREATVSFIIRDDGIGMREEFIPHIFEAFTQDKESYKQEGTGLGLSICKTFVEMMNGHIDVSSKINDGSTFEVVNPFSLGNKVDYLIIDKHYDFSGKRILLVEDNDLNVEVAISFLELVHINVDVAENGKEAIKKFSSEKIFFYDLILMDMKMPVMGGREATREIRQLKREDAKKIPIIAMTAEVLSGRIEESYKNGLNDYITKPFNYENLYLILSKYLTRKKE